MKEVIILGEAPSGRVCPFDAEVWGINSVCTFPWFQDMRFDKLLITDVVGDTFPQEKLDNIKSYGIPINSIQDYADEIYPFDELIEYFGTEYFDNTCARGMALAIYLGYEKIRLYGIDQCLPKYAIAKGGVEYWIGRAHERGIIVDIQDDSCLLKMYRPKEGDANIRI